MKTPTSCEQEIEKIPAGCTNRQAVLPAREHRTSLVLALASEPRVKPLAFGSTPFETQATTPLRKNLPWTAFFTGAYLALMGFGNLTGTVFAVKKLLPVIFHLPVPQILILLSMTCMNLAFAMIGGALLLRRAWARPLG